MALLAYIVAIILFILAGLGVNLGDLSERDLVALGLAAFALAHVLPAGHFPLAYARRANTE